MDRLKPIFEKLYSQSPYIGNNIYIDVETTGLQKDARIIEIGAIAIIFDGLDLSFEIFETLINPGFDIVDKITEITGITNEELHKAPGDEQYDEFVKWVKRINPKSLIAHNAKFDKSKLEYNLYRTHQDIILPPFQCTMEMSRKNLTKPANDKLSTLAEYFQFVNKNAHRALSDTEVCAFIHAKMLLGEYE